MFIISLIYEPGAGCRIRDDYILWHGTESSDRLLPSALLANVELYLFIFSTKLV